MIDDAHDNKNNYKSAIYRPYMMWIRQPISSPSSDVHLINMTAKLSAPRREGEGMCLFETEPAKKDFIYSSSIIVSMAEKVWLPLNGKGPLQMVISSQYYNLHRFAHYCAADFGRGGQLCTVPKRDGNVLFNTLSDCIIIKSSTTNMVSSPSPLLHFNPNRGQQHFVQCIYKYTILHTTPQNTTNVKQQAWRISRKGCTNNIVKRGVFVEGITFLASIIGAQKQWRRIMWRDKSKQWVER